MKWVESSLEIKKKLYVQGRVSASLNNSSSDMYFTTRGSDRLSMSIYKLLIFSIYCLIFKKQGKKPIVPPGFTSRGAAMIKVDFLKEIIEIFTLPREDPIDCPFINY